MSMSVFLVVSSPRRSPVFVVFLAVHPSTYRTAGPIRRGDRRLNFHELRDNLSSP